MVISDQHVGLDDALIRAAEVGLGCGGSTTDLVWEPITGGGSDREFYRVRGPREKTSVVIHYSDAREENAMYAGIARFLAEIGLHVPGLIFHDERQRLIGIEDLGDESLYHVFHRSTVWPAVEALYHAALDQLRMLHRHVSAPVKTMPGFDDKLYRWERNYFLENLVRRWAGIELADSEKAGIDAEGDALAGDLLAAPRCLIHRDFQSQNLVVRRETVWLIDFQGMRPGHAAYDLASLLYDPYVDLDALQRRSLVQWYGRDGILAETGPALEDQFHRAACQRLMQALGAYAFLGLVKGRSNFLQHIPQGLANLEEVLQDVAGTGRTLELVRACSRKCRTA